MARLIEGASHDGLPTLLVARREVPGRHQDGPGVSPFELHDHLALSRTHNDRTAGITLASGEVGDYGYWFGNYR